MTPYAIKVMLEVDDWIYVTEDCKGDPWNLQPCLFKSREDAQFWAERVGWNNYKVVRYRKENDNA